jgi:DNA polymerase-3 subunit alpha
VAPWTERERLGYERELLGFYVTGHPLAAVAGELARYVDVRSGNAAERDGREVRVGGLVTALRETRTRRGETMAFGTLEDLEGAFDLVIFAEPYGRLRTLLRGALEPGPGMPPRPLLLSGKLEAGDPPKLLVRDAVSIEEAEERLASRMRVELVAGEATRDRLVALRKTLGQHPGGCPVLLHLRIPGESETVIALPESWAVEPSDALVRDLDGLFGRRVAELVV